MNLLVVGRGLSRHPEDAAECTLLAAAVALATAGHAIRVLVLEDPAATPPPYVRLVTVDAAALARARASSSPNPITHECILLTDALRAELARAPADLVIATDARAPLHHALMLRESGHFPECPPVIVLAGSMGFLSAPHTARFTALNEHRVHLAERQQVSLADAVIAPSHASAAELRPLLADPARLHVIPPPVAAEWRAGRGSPRTLAHLGAVAYDRAPDFLVYVANQVRESLAPDRLLFIGSTPPCSFRREDVREFLTLRLHPAMRQCAEFTGRLDREASLARLDEAGIAVLLARHDPDPRIAVECLARGLVPIAWQDSPLAEIAGPELAPGFLGRHDFAMGKFAPVVEYWRGAAGEGRLAQLRERARAATDPGAFASGVERIRERLVQARPRIEPSGPRFKPQDITVAFFTFNDAEHLVGSLESLDAQTARPERVLIYDDGTHEPAHLAILDSLASRPGTRILKGPNCDLIPNRMRSIVDAETALLTMVDADDRLAPDFFAALLRTLDANPGAQAAIPARANFDLASEVVTDHAFGTPYHWVWNDYRMASLVTREAATTVSFDPLMKTSATEDWHFWLRFAIHGYRAAFCPLPLFLYRLRAGSRSWPWSEGQASTACVWRQRAMAEARARGCDLAEAAALMEEVAHGALQDLWTLQSGADGTASAEHRAVARAILDSKWFALGCVLGQMAPLRESLADPLAPAEDLRRHLEQSRWMRLRRQP